jgi:ribonuclease P protein component
MALARKHSLKGQKNFERVKEKGKLYQSDSFAVAVYEREDNEVSRFGFVISAKISKIAVHRNRIRRALSETVRMNISFFPKGRDVVFLAKKNITRKTTEQIMREVEQFFRKGDS